MHFVLPPLLHPLGKIIYVILFPYAFIHGHLTRRPRVRALIHYNNQVLLVKNWIGLQEWTLPGGGVKYRESSTEAVRREVKEEVGLTVAEDPKKVCKTKSTETTTSFMIELFNVELTSQPTVSIDGLEIIDYRWVDISALENVTNPRLRNLIFMALKK